LTWQSGFARQDRAASGALKERRMEMVNGYPCRDCTDVALAKRNVRNIIVTINPLTYLVFPIKELSQGLYFRLFTRPNQLIDN